MFTLSDGSQLSDRVFFCLSSIEDILRENIQEKANDLQGDEDWNEYNESQSGFIG